MRALLLPGLMISACYCRPQETYLLKNPGHTHIFLNQEWKCGAADHGIGIPDRINEKIFQPSFTTKATGQGTGLRLSLRYDIVKVTGGSIQAKSVEGMGSEFLVQIPFTTQNAAENQ